MGKKEFYHVLNIWRPDAAIKLLLDDLGPVTVSFSFKHRIGVRKKVWVGSWETIYAIIRSLGRIKIQINNCTTSCSERFSHLSLRLWYYAPFHRILLQCSIQRNYLDNVWSLLPRSNHSEWRVKQTSGWRDLFSMNSKLLVASVWFLCCACGRITTHVSCETDVS